jgi:hypothetical protein
MSWWLREGREEGDDAPSPEPAFPGVGRSRAARRTFVQSDRCQRCGAWRHEHTGPELECPADQKGSSWT